MHFKCSIRNAQIMAFPSAQVSLKLLLHQNLQVIFPHSQYFHSCQRLCRTFGSASAWNVSHGRYQYKQKPKNEFVLTLDTDSHTAKTSLPHPSHSHVSIYTVLLLPPYQLMAAVCSYVYWSNYAFDLSTYIKVLKIR